jgi:predicted nucleic acid-binding Zn ribbon protein
MSGMSGGTPEAPRRANYLATEPPSRAPAGVDEVLAGVIERFGGPSGLAGARLLEEWPEVGGDWSARARAVSVKDGVLVLEVDGGADATLLRYDEGSVRARIQARYGTGLVRSIRVRVARRAGPG